MMRFWAKDATDHLLVTTTSQVAMDNERLQKVWRSLVQSQQTIHQSKEAFFSSQELLKRLSEGP
jgi:hypothetical protein